MLAKMRRIKTREKESPVFDRSLEFAITLTRRQWRASARSDDVEDRLALADCSDRSFERRRNTEKEKTSKSRDYTYYTWSNVIESQVEASSPFLRIVGAIVRRNGLLLDEGINIAIEPSLNDADSRLPIV